MLILPPKGFIFSIPLNQQCSDWMILNQTFPLKKDFFSDLHDAQGLPPLLVHFFSSRIKDPST